MNAKHKKPAGKYVYRARLDRTGTLHQEQFPVVYRNKDYVYVKINGNPRPIELPAWSIIRDIPVALLAEKFKRAPKTAFAFYETKTPAGRIKTIRDNLRRVILAENMADTQMKLEITQTERETAEKREFELVTALSGFKENFQIETVAAKRRAETQSDHINDLIRSGQPVTSRFAHPGTYLYGRKTELLNMNGRMAGILSARPANSSDDEYAGIVCTIRFPDDPDRTKFTVPDFALVDLYGYLPENPNETEQEES